MIHYWGHAFGDMPSDDMPYERGEALHRMLDFSECSSAVLASWIPELETELPDLPLRQRLDLEMVKSILAAREALADEVFDS